MGSSSRAAALAAVGLAVAGGCASGGRRSPAPAGEPARLVGETTRSDIESVRPEWVEETIAAAPDAEIARGLLEVAPAELTVFLGTWCADSQRELARFWRALDGLPSEPPLAVRYVAVDRDKAEPAALLAGVDLLYVPTFVVRRDGRELGRVVEEAPGGIESDLLALLTGRAGGWISAREDLAPPADGGR